MKVIGVIPARFASTRFPGKVLAKLHGKSLIEHVWLRVKKAKLLEDVLIACDDEKVLKEAKGFGAKAVMTSPDHPSGTDRIIEAVKGINTEIVVNIQGDEPLIDPSVVDGLAKALLDDAKLPMATVIKRITNTEDLDNPNVVKAVINNNYDALYFSRSAMPYNRDRKTFESIKYYKHLGIYAYRRDFLLKFKDLPASKLEETEKLEQLRVLEAGYKIRTIETTFETIGVDTPEDLKKVENLIKL